MPNVVTDDMTLSNLRKRRGLTQKQVAQRMGVNPSRVTQIERAYPHVMLPVLMNYMQALGGRVELCAVEGAQAWADELGVTDRQSAGARHHRGRKDYAKLRDQADSS